MTVQQNAQAVAHVDAQADSTEYLVRERIRCALYQLNSTEGVQSREYRRMALECAREDLEHAIALLS